MRGSKNRNSTNLRNGQTAIELAVFGGVVIFLIGLIVRTVLGTSYQQGSRLKALRLAMLTSFEFSEGIKAPPGNWRDGTASRNSASVLIMEDRLSATSAKYATVDRTPIISQGSATHSRNLFMPIDPGEYANLPMTDFFVNGIHIPLTVAGHVRHPLPPVVFKQQYNHPATDFRQCGGNFWAVVDNVGGVDYHRFDLNRNGLPDDGVTNANCANIFWQWEAGSSSRIDIDNGEWTFVDVDDDHFSEQIIGKNGTSSVDTMDFQEGDMHFATDPNVPTPGFSNQDVQMWTFTKNPFPSGDDEGTYLRLDEGRLFAGDTGRYVRDAQRKDSVDVIQRTLQLTKNTQRFCDLAGNLVTVGSQLGNQAGWTADVPNPVEVCSATQAGCFTSATVTQTCMVYPWNPALNQYPIIFVRSRIVDKHGRKYITPTDADPVVNFLK